MPRQIALTRGLVAIVDDEDFDWLSKWKWHASSSGYAARWRRAVDGPGSKSVLMHRVIMSAPHGMCVDHISGDKSDNRRGNLRICTARENSRNSGSSANQYGFKGVRRTHTGKYRASIRVDGKSYCGVSWPTIEEAAREYDVIAREHFGEFARLNFPDAIDNRRQHPGTSSGSRGRQPQQHRQGDQSDRSVGLRGVAVASLSFEAGGR